MGNVKSRLRRSSSSSSSSSSSLSSSAYSDHSPAYPRRFRDLGRQKSESAVATSRLEKSRASRAASLRRAALPRSGIVLEGLCAGGLNHDIVCASDSDASNHSTSPARRATGTTARLHRQINTESPSPSFGSPTHDFIEKRVDEFCDECDTESHLTPPHSRSSLSLCLPFDLCSRSCSSSNCSSPAALIFPAHPGEPLSRYVPTGHTLGRGAFGTVRVCRDSATGGEVAVKTISKRVLALDNPDFADDFRQEVAIMRLVSRSEVSGVVRLLDVRESRDHVHLVMERCNAGSLSALIKSRQRLPEHEAADVIRQLLTTVAGLHKIGVIHRDLKPENVLLCCSNTSCMTTADCQTCSRTGIDAISGVSSNSGDTAREDCAERGRRRSEDSSCSNSESGSTSASASGSPRVPSCPSGGSCDDSACSNGGCSWPSSRGGARSLCHWSVKLADFGLAVCLPAPSAQIRGVAGTAFYMAPEVARGRLYGREADMWSLGVVLHVLLSGRLPFYGRTEDETRKKACAGHVVFSDKYWAGVSGAARQAVLQMLTVEPRWRATAEQVLHCDWLRETGQC